ncbi:hypothetical protein V8F06_010455 [Rhypophila decipiens]
MTESRIKDHDHAGVESSSEPVASGPRQTDTESPTTMSTQSSITGPEPETQLNDNLESTASITTPDDTEWCYFPPETIELALVLPSDIRSSITQDTSTSEEVECDDIINLPEDVFAFDLLEATEQSSSIEGGYGNIPQAHGPSVQQPTVLSFLKPWRPAYLRRRVLAVFALSFTSIAVFAEVLYVLSNAREGLVSRGSGLHHAARYGLIGLLTVVSGLWARVEFQAKMMAPWSRLSEARELDTIPELPDYLDMWHPKAFVAALKNRDGPVTISMAVGLLLVGATVLSGSLVTVENVQVRSPVMITLETKLLSEPDLSLGFDYRELGSYLYDYPAVKVSDTAKSLVFPDGISDESVFQRSKPTPSINEGSLVRYPVDSVHFDVSCQDAVLDRVDHDEGKPNLTLTIIAKSKRCQFVISSDEQPYLTKFAGGKRSGDFLEGYCGPNSNSLENYHIGMVYTSSNTTLYHFDRMRDSLETNVVVYRPSARYQRVYTTLVAGDVQHLTPTEEYGPGSVTPNEFRNLLLKVVALCRRYISRGSNRVPSIPWTKLQSQGFSNDDRDVRWRGTRTRHGPYPEDTANSLLDSYFLRPSLDHSLKMLMILLFNKFFTQPTAEVVEGSMISRHDRLVIQPLVAQSLVSMMGAAAILAVLLAAKRPSSLYLRAAPDTLAGVAVSLTAFLADM